MATLRESTDNRDHPKLSDFTVLIDGTALSDLFFNSALENYNSLDFEDEELTDEQVDEAIRKDAIAFAAMLGEDYVYDRHNPFIDALIEDLTERL